MSGMIAFCGLDCSGCEAYGATQANDLAAQERLLAKWRVEFNRPDMPLQAVICDGCTSAEGRLGGYCQVCEVRACAAGRGVANCAYCSDYSCATLDGFLAHGPQTRALLDEIHRSFAM